RDYGRGRRASALRNARALAVRPISASSAAACTAVPRISVPDGGAGARERGDAGPPSGWAGCARRSGFVLRAVAALPIGVAALAGPRFCAPAGTRFVAFAGARLGARLAAARGGDADS